MFSFVRGVGGSLTCCTQSTSPARVRATVIRTRTHRTVRVRTYVRIRTMYTPTGERTHTSERAFTNARTYTSEHPLTGGGGYVGHAPRGTNLPLPLAAQA